MREPETLEEMSLIRGGALYRFQELAHLIKPNQWNTGRRISITVLVGWVPLVALTAMSRPHAPLVALFKDYRVFASVFIAVPLLVSGQMLIEERFRLIVQHFGEAGLIRPEDSPNFQAILAMIKALRDTWVPELALVVLGCVAGILFVGNDLMFDAPWAARAFGVSISPSPAGWYFQLVTQTIYIVFLGLALWKWFLFVLFFWKVSRLRLQLVPCDPDQSGGLGFLGYSLSAFMPVVIAASTAMGSVLYYQAPHSVFSRASLTTVLALWVAVVLLIFVGPLTIFGPKLALLHRMGYLQYGSLAHLHAEQFHEKWVEYRQAHTGELLTAREMMVLNNLGSSFERLRRMNPLPIDRITLIEVTATAAVPMLPAIMAQVPLPELLKLIVRALF
jgi:hypothetical protein